MLAKLSTKTNIRTPTLNNTRKAQTMTSASLTKVFARKDRKMGSFRRRMNIRAACKS